MEDVPATRDKTTGRFLPGNPGKPKGISSKPKKFDIFKAETENLAAFRECKHEGDIQRLYDRMLADALDGKVKAQELMMKYLVGMPPKVAQIQHLNVNDTIAKVMKAREEAEEREERNIVDGEYEYEDYRDEQQ